MKKFKAYFKMMITAVICMAMSLVPGKKKGQAVEALLGGQAFGSKGNGAFAAGNAEIKSVNENVSARSQKTDPADIRKNAANMQYFRDSNLQRHVAVPTVGPGDRDTDEKKIIIFPTGLCEEGIFIREMRLCIQEYLQQEDSG
ncbi:MAG: hypothetical protein Q4C77_19725 [Eubacteriales bacterium]|nr:hypothetical protein [Eubacteriales bacterium]